MKNSWKSLQELSMSLCNAVTGVVHSIESLAGVDGDGLRCAVFLAGCPLRCIYCHNPDTWKKRGKEYTAEELVKKICRFKPYFSPCGGATFSGGEPLLQADFLLECAFLLEKENVSFVLDTSGSVALSPSVLAVTEKSEGVLLDLKFWDDASYEKYTGVSIEKTLDYLRFLDSIGKKTVLRTVIVPGINDTPEILDGYLRLIDGFHCIKRYELLSFHTLGFHKYETLGITNPLAEKKACTQEKKEKLQLYIDKKRKANA